MFLEATLSHARAPAITSLHAETVITELYSTELQLNVLPSEPLKLDPQMAHDAAQISPKTWKV